MMPPLDYVKYYDIERYLFDDVHEHFHNDCWIGAFDFFSIVIWKANRAKSKIAERLGKQERSGEGLEEVVRRLTALLHDAKDARDRLRLLLDEPWGLRLPIASAILTVLWPDEFTVYDVRVCDELQAHQLGDFHKVGEWSDFDRVWLEYGKYVEAVRHAAPSGLSLRQKDRYLWAHSTAEQLRKDIATSFKAANAQDMNRIGRSQVVPSDPIIDEIRRVRHRISEECGHDPKRLVEHYMKLQERHKDRLVSPSKPTPGQESPEDA